MKARNMTFHGADGNLLAADVFTPENTPPEDADHIALLLHGGGQTRHSWGGTAKKLAGHGLTAITVDARGHGASHWLEDKSYTFEHYARDIIALAKEVRQSFGKKPICIGASLGGLSSMLAQTMAGQDLLEALILVDITPRMDINGVAKILGFMSEKMHHGFDTVEEAADAIAAYLPERKKPKSLDGLQKNLRRGEDGRWRWHWDPGFIDGPLSINTVADDFEQRLLDAAADLTIPTLLVRGGRSELVTEEHANEFLELAPHARFVDVSDAGHMIAGDKNDVFTSAILDFLAEVIIDKN